MASMVTSMGRFAAHTGQEVSLDKYMEHDIEFAPDADKMTLDGEAPVIADANGRYPVPEPGIKKKQEY